MANKLKVLFSFIRFGDDPLVSFLTSVYERMTGHAAFPNPPVDLAAFKAKIDSFAAAIVASLDGSKLAIASKKKLRGELVKMAEQLAHYVEANCHDDEQLLTSSGFARRFTSRQNPQPLAQPSIDTVDQGIGGQLLVNVNAVEKARLYEVRFAPLGTPAAGAWLSTHAANATKSIAVDSLTPGTTYAFQVRAFGVLGFTEWSNAVSRMCI